MDPLADFQSKPGSPLPSTVQQAIHVARALQLSASELQTPDERRQQEELDRMLQHPRDKATLTQLTDQAFRSSSAARSTDQFIHILDAQGIPRFFSALDRTLLRGFQTFGGYAPEVAIPLVKAHLLKETSNVILPAEPELLREHLERRRAEGVRMNVNYLGEAILSEPEAERRLQVYLAALQRPEVEVVSIKISTLYSQISSLARRHTIATLCDRLDALYRTAQRYIFRHADGSHSSKFIYLDMEEYRDMSLTAEVFMQVLARPGLESLSAGIVLQSYIPDSHVMQQRLLAWARQRVASGGAPITLRIVKGANMEMERLEATLRGWPQAPYLTKVETDANYKRMVREGLRPENQSAVRLGIASHNLFELAYGFVLALESGAIHQVQFEMLEGMANHQRRALCRANFPLLLYAPVCRPDQFISAIGYLIRRLDENTGPENFLRHAFRLEVDSADWKQLEDAFIASCGLMDTASNSPRRTQDRRTPAIPPAGLLPGWHEFRNEADTDFSLPHHAAWAEALVDRWQQRCDSASPQLPCMVAGEERFARPEQLKIGRDPSRPGVVAARYTQATSTDIDAALRCADADPDGWRAESPQARFDRLGEVAKELRRSRADLMGAALANAGKTLLESDPEVSEAVDFIEFYRRSARWFQERAASRSRPQGTVVVVSPWNFPIAIPCGGIAAALAAGNTVILKPASDAVLPAWELCQCFWRAGISKKVLQFVPCAGSREGKQLVTHPSVRSVILTGGTSTALDLLKSNPDMALHAETGGKNATVVTALADRDQAIKHALHSAFSHSGQKCSATSLLLLEAEVFDDPHFRQALCEAASSLIVGSAWRLETKVGPLIRPPSGDLERGLKVLEPGETWAMMPRPCPENPSLWSPGIRWGTPPGSFAHLTELFGPVLSVTRFSTLQEAAEIVNATGYGLTSGLESLDCREQERWQELIRAGNLYINRPTTGAIVLRQPFGGQGRSVFGPAMKAGGPNYVAQFMEFEDVNAPGLGTDPGDPEAWLELETHLRNGTLVLPPDQASKLQIAVLSYAYWWREEFSQPRDHFLFPGQENIRSYEPVGCVCVHIDEEDTPFDILARFHATWATGCRLMLSCTEGAARVQSGLLESARSIWNTKWQGSILRSGRELKEAIQEGKIQRIRCIRPRGLTQEVKETAHGRGIHISARPVLADGRVELLWYLKEKSLSRDYHRYGNISAGQRTNSTRGERDPAADQGAQ